MKSSREKGNTMFKKVGRVALAAAFASSMMIPAAAVSALAADAETSISVSGLDTGDTAKYYQIIQQNENSKAWELAGKFGELTLADLLDGIDAVEAGTIVANVSNGTAMDVETTPGTATAGTADAPIAPGTYLVIITPGADNDTIYGPVFVSADYKTGGNTIEASEENELTGVAPDQSAVAKKTTVDITKTAAVDGKDNDSSAQNVGVGDKVAFTVETNVPTFTEAQEDLVFTVSDKVSTGLEIDPATIAVAVAGYGGTGQPTFAETTDYTFVKKAKDGWEISFKESFLKRVNGNPKVTITYKATVTAAAGTTSINELTNEAEVEYTHSPDGNTHSKTDETYHYTYAFDAPVSGNTQDNSEEFIKVGQKADGSPLTETTVTYGEVTASPLAGALFTLTEVGGDQQAFTSTSLDSGLFSFTGLDAGRYTLEETTAPTGFQRDTNTYYVEVIPTFNDDGTLASYTVTCGTNSDYSNSVVSSFTISHDQDGGVVATMPAEEPLPQVFVNVENPALPTTGGMGTMGLTAAGIVLIAGGAFFMLRNRRRNEQQ